MVSLQARDTKYASRQGPDGDVHDRHEKRRTIKSIRLSVGGGVEVECIEFGVWGSHPSAYQLHMG